MISSDPQEAARLVSTGTALVLIVAAGDDPCEPPPGPGRMAIMVGDPADSAVQKAATEMAAELFGA